MLLLQAMILKFYGATQGVTGSNFLLESTDKKTGKNIQVMVDCGLHQGSHYCERHNFEPFPYNPKEIKAVFITHAHIDHSGLLPKLYRHGFRGKVFGTAPTRDFVYALLVDSEDILKREAAREKQKPLYDTKDVDGLMTLWEDVAFDKEIEFHGLKIVFKNAGHILGSSSVIIKADGRSVLFSGDIGNTSPVLINHFDKIEESIDYCLMESTYGARLHEGIDDSKELLENVVEDTVHAGGTLMIPAFAMERTQRLLYELNDLIEKCRIPKVPVFIDSPLAIKLTDIYHKYHDYFSKEAGEIMSGGDRLFNFPGLHFTPTTEESKKINDFKPPKIIIAGSGMSNGGRILHHEIRYLPDPKSTILFIGYQAAGSLGRRILDGEKIIKIFGEEVHVRCRVVSIGGYSAHADQKGLLEWLKPMRATLKKVFLVHGEPEQSNELASQIRDHMAVEAVTPSLNEEIVLE